MIVTGDNRGRTLISPHRTPIDEGIPHAPPTPHRRHPPVPRSLRGVDGSAAPLVTMDREAAHDTLVAVTTEGKALRQDVVLREVARARSALHKASSRIWGAVAAPLTAGIVFLGIAGAMLPGSE